jgi:hypothetical protein
MPLAAVAFSMNGGVRPATSNANPPEPSGVAVRWFGVADESLRTTLVAVIPATVPVTEGSTDFAALLAPPHAASPTAAAAPTMIPLTVLMFTQRSP